MRNDASLYSGAASTSFTTPRVPESRLEARKSAAKKREELLQGSDVIYAEIDKLIAESSVIDYVNMATLVDDDAFKIEMLSNAKLITKLGLLKIRLNNALRDNKQVK